jgi:hypothetical protein
MSSYSDTDYVYNYLPVDGNLWEMTGDWSLRKPVKQLTVLSSHITCCMVDRLEFEFTRPCV